MKFFHGVFLLVISNFISDCHCGLKEYGESCSQRKPAQRCRMDLDLTCEDGTCTCKEMSSYDEEVGACVALIGESCTTEPYEQSSAISRCPKNSICTIHNPNKTPRSTRKIPGPFGYYLHDYPSNGLKCYCEKGYYPDPHEKSTCIQALQANEPCDTSSTPHCHKDAGLTCDPISSTCQCSDQKNSRYDEEEKRCLVKLGTNCTIHTFCDKNAICSEVLQRHRHSYDEDIEKSSAKCVCLPGFDADSDGKCLGSYSVPCSESSPCNADSFLSCIDGLCQCEAGAHQIFTGVLGEASCKFLVNSTCKPNADGPECVDNSECTGNEISNNLEDIDTRTCQCTAGHSPAPSGQCLPSYKSECSSLDLFNRTNYKHFVMYNSFPSIPANRSCNFYEGLACVDGKCECFDSDLIWDEIQGVCIAGEGQRCGVIEFNQGHDPINYPKVLAYRPLQRLTHYYYVGCNEKNVCVKNKSGVESWNVCATLPVQIQI